MTEESSESTPRFIDGDLMRTQTRGHHTYILTDKSFSSRFSDLIGELECLIDNLNIFGYYAKYENIQHYKSPL